MKTFSKNLISTAVVATAAVGAVAPAMANAAEKPNIVVIMADDIGWFNTSAYNNGMMGYKTPNIDRVANEGMLFTDHYGQPSSTAGRAAFLTGQLPIRTGLLNVGLPGSPVGLSPSDPTLAEVLKEHGYMTNQLGKNHLGDQEHMLPHRRGFDNFYGNLYHLNAEEEPENEDYPQDPAFAERFGPRGMVTGTADGPTGNDGPLTRKRMETIDRELTDMAVDYIEAQAKTDDPFFLWYNPSRMHVWTHLSEEWAGKTGFGLYADGMNELDHYVGELLDTLEKTGQKDNTIVIFTTDNGAEKMSWPDGGNTPFKGEKGLTTEGGTRVPFMVMWPNKIPAGSVNNGIQSHEDLFTTLATIAGEKDVQENFKKKHDVYIDGYDHRDAWFNNEDTTRNEIFYFAETGNLEAVRVGKIKATFIQPTEDNWFAPRLATTWPQLVDLRADPFEEAPEHSMMYLKWFGDRMFFFVPVQVEVAKLLQTFQEFPLRQAPTSFNLERVMQQMPYRPDAK
ncbi:arylsulfatase [Vibrio sp. ZSDE26]|uniref:Arylsulfatase n=1 Tax=Vibrio amylolyticus TaxID=2847292 RepID=A0A9X2BKF7_9VIBR|nr:arylsulfatase [Vibrio amylolyticus]MCK6262778.1 arylsulfatase [Vibrio amylolyticus]